MFTPTSRYAGLELGTTTVDGRTVAYVRRRPLPPVPPAGPAARQHLVAEGDRLDNLAAQYLDDPEQFWRLADLNAALRPEELTETMGRPLRIPMPGGIDGDIDD